MVDRVPALAWDRLGGLLTSSADFYPQLASAAAVEKASPTDPRSESQDPRDQRCPLEQPHPTPTQVPDQLTSICGLIFEQLLGAKLEDMQTF